MKQNVPYRSLSYNFGHCKRCKNRFMNDFEILTRADISLLRLTSYEWSQLSDSKNQGKRFSLIFPHAAASSAKKNSLVIILVQEKATEEPYHDSEAPGLKVGLVKSKQPVSTLDSRISFDLVDDLSESSLQELLLQIPESNLKASIARTSAGRFFFHVMASLAQMKRELSIERTKAGLAAARKLGRIGGRKRIMTESKVRSAKKLLANGLPPKDVARDLGVSIATLYRWLPAAASC